MITAPLAILTAYHVLWLLSDLPYSRAALAAILGCGAVALPTAVLSRRSQSGGSVMRLLLALFGAAATTLGALMVLGAVSIGRTPTNSVVGALVFVGGFFIVFCAIYLQTDGAAGQAPPKVAQEEPYPLSGGVEARTRKFRNYGGRSTDRIASICASELNLEDLHYIAYYLDGSCRFSMDVMGHTDIADRFGDVEPDARRTQYLKHGTKLDRLMVGLNREFREIDSGILLRVVLDVERGALYYFYLDEKRFLIGVTLDQDKVHKADRKMVNLVDEIRYLLGHKRIEDLNR